MQERSLRVVLWLGLVFACAPGLRAATLYTNDGSLSPRLELERWRINRARYGPEREADGLSLTNSAPGGHPDYDVCEDADAPNDFGTSPAEWEPWTRSRPPLAPNARMNQACANHCLDMAETGLFQHQSPSDNYYPLNSDGIDRSLLEGYTNTIFGYYENIASGSRWSSVNYPAYGRTPTSVHEGLFVDATSPSRGHRQGILNTRARELGLGTCRVNDFLPDFWGPGMHAYITEDFDTQLFGREGNNHFFTGTLFHDANANALYDEGEGVSNIAVRLFQDGLEAAWYDVSGDAGGFTVPINGLADGTEVEVRLANLNGEARHISIPLGFSNTGTCVLSPAVTVTTARFTQPAGVTNIGWRNSRPNLYLRSVTMTAGVANIAMHCWAGLPVVLQSCDNVFGSSWTTFETVVPTNGTLTVEDTGQGGRPPPSVPLLRFYRFLVPRD